MNICPNAYYNYRKHRKAAYYTQKSKVQAQIREIYHEHNGVDGYRSMTVYLARKGFHYSPITIHKYMNKEMGLYAIVRPKKPEYLRGKPHKAVSYTHLDVYKRQVQMLFYIIDCLRYHMNPLPLHFYLLSYIDFSFCPVLLLYRNQREMFSLFLLYYSYIADFLIHFPLR